MLSIHRQTEEDLIEQCIKGNAKSQKEIYDRYSSRMYGVCLRYIKNEQIAEDILISGFMKVYDKIHQFKFEGSFEGWIRRIMVNESLSYLRQNKQMFIERDIETAGNLVDFHTLDTHLEQEDLMKMIALLPDGYRMVFNLYAIEGFSHREIAGKLGIQESTSKSQLSRARAMLRNQLVESENRLKQKLTGL
ncbi:MAG: RNA polymerase sigma factor [Cyclobacteriaceae bacterium]|nr:RNA polymerase sigma factor [Cyclobacteriaceae bacterium]